MRLAIIGAGCAFGMNLARYMIGRGWEVLGIGRSPLKGPAFTLGLEASPQWRYKVHSLTAYYYDVFRALDEFRPAVVVNFAALGERAGSCLRGVYSDYFNTNAVALARLQDGLQGKDYLERFIQVSSGEVYGSHNSYVQPPNCIGSTATDETYPLSPSTPYAASKAAFDLHLMAVHKSFGFPMNILRPSNLYCPGQQMHRLIPKAILCALTGKKLPLNGGGKGRKAYMHATDLSRAIEIVIKKAPLGEIYNVSPDHNEQVSYISGRVGCCSMREIVEMVSDITGVPMADLVEEAPARPAADATYWFDSRKLQALGWQRPSEVGGVYETMTIKPREGMREMVEWVMKYQRELEREPAHYDVQKLAA